MAKPKLCLIPSAIGDKLYSVLPSDGSGDFDFTRATTATRVNKDGLIETVASGDARLNYPMIDGKVSGCPSHLLEPSRTNLITQSEDFSSSIWSKTRCTITSNQAISPNGTQTADLMTSTGDDARLEEQAGASGSEYTQSIYVKSAQTSDVDCQLDFAGLNIVTFKATQEWQRIETTLTDTSQTPRLRLRILNSSNSVYVWGGQIEQGSYATSYIPTNGSTVTRSAETANGSGDADTFNDSEGVLMAEISALADDGGGSGTISISDTSFDNIVKFGYRTEENKINVVVRSDAQNIFDIQADVENLTNYLKICLKYKQNDFSLYVNGFKINEQLNGSNPLNLSKLQLADANASLNPFYGNTKQIQYFNTALTDSELVTLTSWTSFNEMATSQLYSVY